jgi:hypothetical protein
MIIAKQIFYVLAVVVVMIIASRYMKKIPDPPEERLDPDDEPTPEDHQEPDEITQ